MPRRRSALSLNPSLELRIELAWQARGRGRRTLEVTGADRALVRFVIELLGSGETERPFGASPELATRLLEEGVLVNGDDPLTLPEDVPALRPRFGGPTRSTGELEVNPDCHFQADHRPPAALAERLARWKRLCLCPPLVWIDDPGPRLLLAHGLSSSSGQAARALLTGRTTPAKLPRRLRELLVLARILVPRGERARRRRSWGRLVARLRERLRAQKLAVLPPLLPPLQIAAWRSYARGLERDDRLAPDLRQVEGRRHAHREPRVEFLHEQTVDLVSRIVGAPLKASYSLLAAYPPGSVLKPHRDRPQCRWNVSLVLDTEPETPAAEAWPLWIETPDGPEAVRLPLGAGVLYSGTDVEHWRDAQPAGHRMAAALFHYVDQSFTGGLD
jgi:hypothetical protein